ncbi:glycine zipper 2TM domain-containing protein [Kangiella sp. TOML190]|uniref:glycine zipper 2TM domain-containing protein n=1 Tax=Kangiella sp. TOML190 TaxID=2931351 RepID=UPI00203E8ADF|nr:glycine zipper 2TM domain-containing protein [Kangiella sp. TOML190]
MKTMTKTVAKKRTTTHLTAASLAIALAFSGGLLADDKKSKHYYDGYGDRNFNGQYQERYSNYSDYQESYRDRHQPIYSRIKRAKVLAVDPVYQSVRSQPRRHQECWSETRRGSRSDRAAGSLLGAVVGGVIGYKVGGNHRHNKRSGAAVGAVVGSVIGSEAAKNKQRRERHCETVYSGGYDRQELIGYNVTYKYKGERYTTFSDYDPGRYIDIRVTAEPVRR